MGGKGKVYGITNGPFAIFILPAGEAGSTIHRRVSGVSIEVLELGMRPISIGNPFDGSYPPALPAGLGTMISQL